MWSASLVSLVLWLTGLTPAGGPLDEPPSPLAAHPSPFVRRHAAGPIAWRLWSDDAFEQARRNDRPVFVLLGRADVGAPSLASDPETAGLLNRRFVPVIADRDDRPDAAAFCGAAFELLAGGTRVDPGGALWLFLTPEGGAFFAEPATEGTSLRDLALGIAADYTNKPAELVARGRVVLDSLRELQSPPSLRGTLRPEAVDLALARVRAAADDEGAATAGGLRLLLRPRAPSDSLRTGTRLLDALGVGPRRDAGVGGFWDAPSRQSKSLADNLQLLEAHLDAYVATHKVAYREAAEAVATWIARDLADPGGGFRPRWSPGAGAGDDRVLAGWNGLAIAALARSGRLLGRPHDVEAARHAAAAVIERLGPAASLRHCAAGSAHCGPAFLVDYAGLAVGLLDLHEATGEERWLRVASDLIETALLRFLDPVAGGFFESQAGHGRLPLRLKGLSDRPVPSGNALLAQALVRLGRVAGELRYGELARRGVEAVAGDVLRQPFGKEALLRVAHEMAGGPSPPVTTEPLRPARESRGPVTVEASLSVAAARSGDAIELAVQLTVAPGWSVVAHQPGSPGFAGLAVSVPSPEVTVRAVRYPAASRGRGGWGEADVQTATATVLLTLKLRPNVPAGATSLRVGARFQACDATECRPPDSVLLDVPIAIAEPSR